mmetsp:Transcript_10328/g.18901  ORF Transcript_10328/g.18901 Transcript_10328/m.18901 type:complete len:700 (-) Transcript_10328:87-2186(-)
MSTHLILAFFFFCLLAAPNVEAALASVRLHANPIRRVVTMLGKMQAKITEEGKEHKELFDKFMCSCQTNFKSLEQSIATAEQNIPLIESSLMSEKQEKLQLDGDIEADKTSRTAAENAIAEAKSMREKAAAEYADESAQMTADIAALTKAIPLVEKGMSGSFLQSGAVSVLQRLSVSLDMKAADREKLSAFLSDGTAYEPQSGEILGILKQLKDEMSKNLEEITVQETEAVSSHEALVEAKEKEIAALTKSIEEKSLRSGDLAVQIAGTTNDLEDTREALSEDRKFMSQMKNGCTTAANDFEAYKAMQSEELKAISETIDILNDDDALDLFKKTLPSASASFMQLQVTAGALRRRALMEMRARRAAAGRPAGRGGDPRLDLLEVAIRGGKIGFEGILKMIDGLVVTLKAEQVDDNKKKAYCEKELEESADAATQLNNQISTIQKVIDDKKEDVSALESNRVDRAESIRRLDKQVGDATATRKEEHSLYVTELANLNAAKELLEMAKGRLNKFYNPDLGKEGSAASFVQLGMRRSSTVQPSPGYTKKSEDNAGVIALIDSLIADVTKEINAMMLEETDAQEDYEKLIADAKVKRASDSKAMANREGMKAEVNEEIILAEKALKLKKTEKMENDKYVLGIETECTWFLKYFDLRRETRNGEIDALYKAKAVFSGASGEDYSFVQTASSVSRLRGAHRTSGK